MLYPVLNVHLLVKRFLKTGETVTASCKAFRVHFLLRRNDVVPDRIKIELSNLVYKKTPKKQPESRKKWKQINFSRFCVF